LEHPDVSRMMRGPSRLRFKVFWRRQTEELDAVPPPPDRSWPTRIAWGVLIGGFALVLTRASVATVVRVHGTGMDPTISDGDGVLLIRSTLSLEAGDIVVYDPTLPSPAEETLAEELHGQDPTGDSQFGDFDPAQGPLPNTAVVDVEGVEKRWGRLSRAKSGPKGPPATYRIGRVLALPGDAVSFHVPNVPLGLAINGVPLRTESATARDDAEQEGTALTRIEMGPQGPYQVRPSTQLAWPGMVLPDDNGPVQIRADGYLIVADNRDESACCDSRAIGWVPSDHVRGEIALRIRAHAPTTQEGREATRVQWLP
jgi:signal peptidase I